MLPLPTAPRALLSRGTSLQADVFDCGLIVIGAPPRAPPASALSPLSASRSRRLWEPPASFPQSPDWKQVPSRSPGPIAAGGEPRVTRARLSPPGKPLASTTGHVGASHPPFVGEESHPGPVTLGLRSPAAHVADSPSRPPRCWGNRLDFLLCFFSFSVDKNIRPTSVLSYILPIGSVTCSPSFSPAGGGEGGTQAWTDRATRARSPPSPF